MKAEKTLEHLNSLLATVCNQQLEMKFGKYKKMMQQTEVASYSKHGNSTQYLLCLMFDGRCISSIEIRINKKTVEISSKTNPIYEGRRYNLLLRAATILIVSQISTRPHTMRTRSQTRSRIAANNINQLVSRAINPISTFVLVKYFNAENKEFDVYLRNNQIEKKNLSLQDVHNFDETRWENIDDADIENNSDFGEPLLLIVRFNKATLNRVKQVFIETLGRIGCPMK